MITKEKAIEIMNKILNEMPVDGYIGYRTDIGDKFREEISRLNSTTKNK